MGTIGDKNIADGCGNLRFGAIYKKCETRKIAFIYNVFPHLCENKRNWFLGFDPLRRHQQHTAFMIEPIAAA